MLTTEQARKYLNVSLSTIHKWIHAGKIPCHRLGRNWRFWKHELDEWIAAGGPENKEWGVVK
jgi:excisionase family DNA binding protein